MKQEKTKDIRKTVRFYEDEIDKMNKEINFQLKKYTQFNYSDLVALKTVGREKDKKFLIK